MHDGTPLPAAWDFPIIQATINYWCCLTSRHETWRVNRVMNWGTQVEIQAAWNEIEGTTVPTMGGHEYRYPFCTKSLEGKLFYMPLCYPNSIGMASEKGGPGFGIQIFPACSLYIYICIYIQMHTYLSSIALYYITLHQLYHINILYHVITWYIILSLFIIVIIMIVILNYVVWYCIISCYITSYHIVV